MLSYKEFVAKYPKLLSLDKQGILKITTITSMYHFNITFNIIGIYLGYYDGESSFLYMLNHLDLPLYYWWASILCIYFLYALIGKNNELLYEKIKSIIITLNIIFTTLTLFLPFKIVINEKVGYAIGACVNFVYAISALYLVISIIISLLLIKRNNSKKYSIINNSAINGGFCRINYVSYH